MIIGPIYVAEGRMRFNATIFMLCLVAGLLRTTSVCAWSADDDLTVDALLDMSIEDLMGIEIAPTVTLTKTDARKLPAAVTTITQEEIQSSGARTLFEVLEARVPNLQFLHTREHLPAMGLRGIIAHRSNKYLLLVNGRIMNEKTDFGVQSEVDMPLLRDIHRIEVIRGPGSVLYGPGALAMVINIITDRPGTYQGNEVTVRAGTVEDFGSVEYKSGWKFGEDSGLLLYTGYSQYDGASGNDSPMVYGSTITRNDTTYGPDQKIDDIYKPLNGSHDDHGKVKLHAHYSNGGFEIWTRFTQGGGWIDHSPNDGRQGLTYTQATALVSYNWEVNESLTIKPSFSYDSLTNESFDDVSLRKQFRENEYHAKIITQWTPHEDHLFAFGSEWSREEFGRDFKGEAISNQPFLWHFPPTPGGNMPQWDTDHRSIFGEYQWKISEQWTTFAGGRLDRHDFTEDMPSWRGVIVYTPTEKDTVKLIASESMRTNTAAEMVMDDILFDKESQTEELMAYELRYERQHTAKVFFAGSAFYHDHDVVDHVGDGAGTVPVGNVTSWGLEGELSFRGERLRLDLSHSYTKMLDMDLQPNIAQTFVSAEPFGFGDDFAHWHNHSTKLFSQYRFDDHWAVNGGIQKFWGVPGGEDYAEFRSSRGSDRAFTTNVYLNLGLQYQVDEATTFRIDGHNLLGLVDDELNIRRIGFSRSFPAQYRTQPAALSLSLTHRF